MIILGVLGIVDLCFYDFSFVNGNISTISLSFFCAILDFINYRL